MPVLYIFTTVVFLPYSIATAEEIGVAIVVSMQCLGGMIVIFMTAIQLRDHNVRLVIVTANQILQLIGLVRV